MNKNYLKTILIIFVVIMSVGLTACINSKLSAKNLAQKSENDYRYVIEVNGKYGYINRKGEEVIKPQYDYAGEFSEGLAPVCNKIDDNDNQECGYVDIKGKLQIPLKYASAEPFSDGFGLIQMNTKYGFVNKSGKLVIKPGYIEAQSFSEGLAAVKIGNKWGFIDKDGNIRIKPKFDVVRSFSEGLAWFGKLEQSHITSHGYMNKKGERVIKFKEFFLSQDFNSGLAPKQTDDDCTYINKNGEEILSMKKLGLNAFREPEGGCAPFSNNLLAVQYGKNLEKFGYIDTTGKLKIKLDIQYKSSAKMFPSYQITSPQLIKIADSSNLNDELTYGFVNKKGEIIVEPVYSYASDFRNGLAVIYKNGENKYIDESGKVVWSNKSKAPLIMPYSENEYYPYRN